MGQLLYSNYLTVITKRLNTQSFRDTWFLSRPLYLPPSESLYPEIESKSKLDSASVCSMPTMTLSFCVRLSTVAETTRMLPALKHKDL